MPTRRSRVPRSEKGFGEGCCLGRGGFPGEVRQYSGKRSGRSICPFRGTSKGATFLRTHWGAIAGADFFTTEAWTWRGLVTYYTVFVTDLPSRRVLIVGSTHYPSSKSPVRDRARPKSSRGVWRIY
jgi:hypothetical protein